MSKSRRNTLASLQAYAEKLGFVVERVGKTYEWYHKDIHSMIGVCHTIQETFDEINSEFCLEDKPNG